MAYPPIQFYAAAGLRVALEARVDRVARAEKRDSVGLGMVAMRDLERYYALLSAELARIDLSVGEAMLLCDVLNGSAQHNNMTPPLTAEVEDAFEDRDAEGRPLLANKWDIDPDRLLAKLRRLGPAATWAVVEAVERWWSGPYRREGVDHETTLREVGLIRARQEI